MFMKKNSTVNENENVVNLSVLETYMSNFCKEKDLKEGKDLTRRYSSKKASQK